MSLLNLTNDGLPSVLLALVEWLSQNKGTMEESELLEQVGAPNAVEEPRMVRQTLNKWTELGFFVKNGTSISMLDFGAKLQNGPSDPFITTIRRAARKIVFSEKNNENLWAKEGAKSADLTRALSWLLAQNVYTTSVSPQLEAIEAEQIRDPQLRLVQNDTRRNGLQKWANFLGFVRKPEKGDIDPTVAVSETLPLFMNPGQALKASDFLSYLAQELPVLDGGRFRRDVEAKLNPQAISLSEPLVLSTSLSRALIYLRIRGDIVLESRADAGDNWMISGRDGIREDLRFTHVALTRT